MQDREISTAKENPIKEKKGSSGSLGETTKERPTRSSLRNSIEDGDTAVAAEVVSRPRRRKKDRTI